MSEDRVFAKCAWRLIPFMGLLYLFNFLDRLNVGFAALTMNRDLGFSPTVFGFGAGALFAGYLLFQVPGSVMFARFGTRRCIFSIMIVWGLLSASCAFIQGPVSFYVLRFLLGAAEAAFFPGVMFYLTLWFPKAYRVRYAALFVSAIAYSGIIGGPLSGIILAHAGGVAGLHNWQWLFLLEGLPVFILAFAVPRLLPDGPAQAPWLNESEKATIAARLNSETVSGKADLGAAFRDPRIVVLAIAGLAHGAALYGTTLWLPLIVQEMGFSNLATGFATAGPYLVSAVVMVLWGRSSDRTGERIWHLICAWLLCALGLVIAASVHSTAIQLLGLTFAVTGILTAISQHMTMPSWFLRGPAAAGGIGLINTVVSLAGAVSQPIIGMIKEQTGGYAASMVMLAFGLVLASLLVGALLRGLGPSEAAAKLVSRAPG
jgi:ACS family tartrate transporter-like MFS transporter